MALGYVSCVFILFLPHVYPLLISTVCANTNDLHKRVDKEGIIETAPGMPEPDEEDEEEEKEEETDNDEEEKSE